MRALRGRWGRLAWPAAFAVAGVLLFIAYLAQSTRGSYVNSDGAANALQAWDMLHGNVLLHGWALADVSFYTTDMPQYMLAESLRGLGPDVVHISGALTYTVLVLLAGWLAKGRPREGDRAGREGLTRVLIAAGIMLAPQFGAGTGLLLLSPDHVGTCIPLLLAWLIVDRFSPGGQPPGDPPNQGAAPLKPPGGHEAPRVLVPLAVGLLLAWAAVGDPLAEVIGVLPLAAVCGMRAYRAVVVRGARPSTCRYELSLTAAALLAVPAASMATRLIAANGGWTDTAARTSFAPAGLLVHNAVLTYQGLLQLFGADFTGQPMNHQAIFAVLHLAGAGLAAWALWLASRRFLGAELLVQVLTAAIIINLAAYLFSVQAQDITRTREIVAVLPFGAVLAGRLLAGRLLAARLAPAMGVVLAGYAVILFSNAVQPPVPAPTSDLTVWLAAHDFTHGLAGYWQANSVTLDSRDAVQVRAVTTNGGKLTSEAYWDARSSWYDPATHYADFIVSTGPRNRWQDQPLMRQMEARAGKPAKVYHFGPYTIAVWHQNLLFRLR
jgi:hypothetical protein